MTAQFEPGKTYTCRSIGDYSCIITARILKRTAKTVTAEVEGKAKTFRPGIYDEAEYIRPWGSYSMAPILRAG